MVVCYNHVYGLCPRECIYGCVGAVCEHEVATGKRLDEDRARYGGVLYRCCGTVSRLFRCCSAVCVSLGCLRTPPTKREREMQRPEVTRVRTPACVARVCRYAHWRLEVRSDCGMDVQDRRTRCTGMGFEREGEGRRGSTDTGGMRAHTCTHTFVMTGSRRTCTYRVRFNCTTLHE